MGIWGTRKLGRKASHVEDTQRGQKSIILRYVELWALGHLQEQSSCCPETEPLLSMSQFWQRAFPWETEGKMNSFSWWFQVHHLRLLQSKDPKSLICTVGLGAKSAWGKDPDGNASRIPTAAASSSIVVVLGPGLGSTYPNKHWNPSQSSQTSRHRQADPSQPQKPQIPAVHSSTNPRQAEVSFWCV